jgi:hypothetical protein
MKRLYKTRVTRFGIEVTFFPGSDDPYEPEYTREYWIMGTQGFAYYRDKNGNIRQVCARMYDYGITLYYSSDEKLVRGIRRELRKWRADKMKRR